MTGSVLFLVTHLMGIGHLVRTAALARACVRLGLRTTVISGGMPVSTLALEGLDLVQLEPVKSDGLDFTRLLDRTGQPATERLLHGRIGQIGAVVRGNPPDVLVTEHWPFGRRVLAREFAHALEQVRGVRRNARWLVSIRDVLVPPSRPDRLSSLDDRLVQGSGDVLVHGDPAVLPLDASWPVSKVVSARLRYTGYVTAGSHQPAATGSRPSWDVIVSGGGGVTSGPLLDAALAAARLGPSHLRWLLLAGPGVPESVRNSLAQAAPANAVVENARADFATLLRDGALSISQFGYNTAMDLLEAGGRALVVPFETAHDREQRLRADRFAAAGLVSVLPGEALSARTLLGAALERLHAPPSSAGSMNRAGADRSAAMIQHASLTKAELGAAR